MSNLNSLITQALEVRKKYAADEIAKNGKPWQRSELVRGFVADVGALSKLTMAADGLREVPNYKQKLGHELADCLWSVLVIANEYDIDLEKEFSLLIDQLSKKLSDL